MISKEGRIFITCHKEAKAVTNAIFTPIQAGTAVSDHCIPGILHDNEGENISERNPLYCELTAQYWAWKNTDYDYYGFFHYRRYLSFSEDKHEKDVFGNIREERINDQIIEKYNLTERTIKEYIDQYDVIIPKRCDTRRFPERCESIYDHYKADPYLNSKDIDRVLRIIERKSPEYSKYANELFGGSIACFCNIYILRADLFREYCEWVFDILDTFCAETDLSDYSVEGRRTPGHISERLFNVFLNRCLDIDPGIKVKELDTVLFEDTAVYRCSLPEAFTDGIPVVFAADNSYVPYFSVCLQSLLDCVSHDNRYDIVLIIRGINAGNSRILLNQIDRYENVSLRFFDPTEILQGYSLKANAHISAETYYRFIIQDILPDHEKVLYLDSDIIVKRDVAELFSLDIHDKLVGAVHDADFLGQINGGNPATEKYAREELHMSDPFQYFQAGVLLINTKEMRKLHDTKYWIERCTRPYMFNDQDILNIECEGRVEYIPMQWNLMTDCDHKRIKDIISFAPAPVYKEYMDARRNPYIIHFAGFRKPWSRINEDMADEFWTICRSTPFYEKILLHMLEDTRAKGFWERVREEQNRSSDIPFRRKVRNVLFPSDTRRRELIDQLYMKLFVLNKQISE